MKNEMQQTLDTERLKEAGNYVLDTTRRRRKFRVAIVLLVVVSLLTLFLWVSHFHMLNGYSVTIKTGPNTLAGRGVSWDRGFEGMIEHATAYPDDPSIMFYYLRHIKGVFLIGLLMLCGVAILACTIICHKIEITKFRIIEALVDKEPEVDYTLEFDQRTPSFLDKYVMIDLCLISLLVGITVGLLCGIFNSLMLPGEGIILGVSFFILLPGFVLYLSLTQKKLIPLLTAIALAPIAGYGSAWLGSYWIGTIPILDDILSMFLTWVPVLLLFGFIAYTCKKKFGSKK